MKKPIIFIFSCCLLNICYAASVDTISIYSAAMKKSSKCVVITPDSYKKNKNGYPVVYLLHGHSGDYSNWIKKVPAIKQYADRYQLIIACPDGHYSSWYFDSPVDSSMKYETYIGIEVPAYIDANYKTIKQRSARAITGLSMGGHGGLFLGFRHANIFGACGSMSGGMDLYPFHNSFDIMKRLGDTIRHADNWKKYSVIDIVDFYPKDSISIIFDCGLDDFFYPTNYLLHAKMVQLNIPHEYIERPGKHDWVYWTNAIEYQLLFFRKFFEKIPSEYRTRNKE
jgi:S-formylglutathione hydrolase FrmB